MASNMKIIDGAGVACPRCGRRTQIREHVKITERELRQPFYFSRWFNCTNPHCRTTIFMLEEYKVYPPEDHKEEHKDVALEVLNELYVGERPPWE